jgi:hypothetical protein
MSTADKRFHESWFGMVQPDGLVVSVPVLCDADIVNRARGRDLYPTLLELCPADDEGVRTIADREAFLAELLDLRPNDFDTDDCATGDALPADLHLYVPEGQQDLRPTKALKKRGEAVPADQRVQVGDDSTPASRSGEAYELLVWELPEALPFDKPETTTGPWDYPPAAKFDRLLRHCRVPIGLLINDAAVRLVYAPHGESSGSVTFQVEDMATVGGRDIFDALIMLLSADRFFAYEPERCLPGLLKASRERQADVTEALAGQVFDALQILLSGFEAAAERDGWDLINDALAQDDEQLYAGLLTVLLRLVFVLYAEDRGLLPVEHDFYTEHLSLLEQFEELQQDAAAYPDAIGRRFGAWGRLVALFRAIYEGVKHDDLDMPARRGDLFSPHAFPFLEGWGPAGSAPIKPVESRAEVKLPTIDDGTVYRVLDKLLILEGQRLSYRALDVEQIGSVYEALMGYHVLRATEPMVCLRGDKKQRVWLGAEELLAVPKGQRTKWLQQTLGLSKAQAGKVNKAVTNKDPAEALKVLESFAIKGTETASAMRLVLQPGEERRRTSSHYTPRSLSAPIVQRTLEPLIAAMGDEPSSEALLDLKICDPAMGSGAFLVEACRFLADQVIAAWTREGKTELVASAHEDVTTHARRLVAQRCLYGVDKNSFAVNLAKLSLWLVTLAKEEPFTFVDHCLKHGDSLVGLDFDQIKAFHWKVCGKNAPQQLELCRKELETALADAIASRQAILDLAGDGSSSAQREKERLLLDANDALNRVRLISDLVVGAYFLETKDKVRQQERDRRLDQVQVWLANGGPPPSELLGMQDELRRQMPPFHWMVEFPEVFYKGRADPLAGQSMEAGPAYLDAFVGNPPFGGINTISKAAGLRLKDWLWELFPGDKGNRGNIDYSAHFFRRADQLLGPHGTVGLIATNTIAQGDTRRAGLQHLLSDGHLIYDASENRPWPGDAAVMVSVIHLAKGMPQLASTLDLRLAGKSVEAINSRLRPKPERPNPVKLVRNRDKAFQGCIVLGMGFTLSPKEMDALVSSNPENAERIQPYIGGKEVSTDPEHCFSRYVINFGDLRLEEARRWPDLIQIVRERVKPERDALHSNNAWNRDVKNRWWQFAAERRGLADALAGLQRCLVTLFTAKHLTFSFQPTDRVFANTLWVFPVSAYAWFSVLQSRVHAPWAQLLSSSMKTDLRYTASDCFETFPFPAHEMLAADSPLEAAGEALYEARASYMVEQVTGQAPIFFRRKSGSTLGSDRDLRLVWSRTRKRRFPREARHVSMP